MAVGLEDVVAWLEALQPVYAEHRQRLTDLDAAIGDADHGINLDRGFTTVKAELAKVPPANVSAALKTAAITLIRTVGGASGPLYGTFFLRASAACGGKEKLREADVVAMFEAGIAGVQERGKAELGDKTMVDAFLPALEAMKKALADGSPLGEIMDRGAAGAEEGMKATVPLQARKGRASYLGERSIGHQDPGATSSHLLLRAAATLWR